MFKVIARGQSHLDAEYNGRKVRFHGDGMSGRGFLAWANSTDWLGFVAPMTVEEKMEIMRSALQYYGDDDTFIDFIAEITGKNYEEWIYYDSQCEPYAYIDGKYIKSSKADSNCICGWYDEMDGFSENVYKRLKYAIANCVEYKPVKQDYIPHKLIEKVHVWKRYGKYKEKWYKCMKCGQVWRLVHPKDSFKGIWRRVK